MAKKDVYVPQTVSELFGSLEVVGETQFVREMVTVEEAEDSEEVCEDDSIFFLDSEIAKGVKNLGKCKEYMFDSESLALHKGGK